MRFYKKNNLHDLRNRLQLYLYGHRTINCVDNRNILLSTIKIYKVLDVSEVNPGYLHPPPPNTHTHTFAHTRTPTHTHTTHTSRALVCCIL